MSEQPAPPPLALGLSGLRSYVTISCVVVMIALVVQIFVWSLVTFTDLRFKIVEPPPSTETVVQPVRQGPRPASQVTTMLPPEVRQAIKPGPIKIRSAFDHLFSDLTAVSLAAGSLALLVLVLLLVVGVNLMTSQAMTGVDRAISALVWAIIVTVIALPAADLLELPWKGSALRSYGAIVQDVDAAAAMQHREGFSFYVSFFFMPALCLAGVFVIERRFRLAVQRNLPQLCNPFLDPSLEAETADVRASSLHGAARNAGALDRLVAIARHREVTEAAADQATRKPTEQAPSSKDENCRRLI